MVDAYLEWLKLFQGVSFFLVDCELFLWRLGVGDVDKMSAKKRTKLHHLKRDSRECMPPERLINAELYQIYTPNVQ